LGKGDALYHTSGTLVGFEGYWYWGSEQGTGGWIRAAESSKNLKGKKSVKRMGKYETRVVGKGTAMTDSDLDRIISIIRRCHR